MGLHIDKAFRDQIIQQLEQLDSTERKIFLLAIKFMPEKILRAISDTLAEWIIGSMMDWKTGFLIQNYDCDAFELLEDLRCHFAKELAEIQPV
jgi:hypothetical protein